MLNVLTEITIAIQTAFIIILISVCPSSVCWLLNVLLILSVVISAGITKKKRRVKWGQLSMPQAPSVFYTMCFLKIESVLLVQSETREFSRETPP